MSDAQGPPNKTTRRIGGPRSTISQAERLENVKRQVNDYIFNSTTWILDDVTDWNRLGDSDLDYE